MVLECQQAANWPVADRNVRTRPDREGRGRTKAGVIAMFCVCVRTVWDGISARLSAKRFKLTLKRIKRHDLVRRCSKTLWKPSKTPRRALIAFWHSVRWISVRRGVDSTSGPLPHSHTWSSDRKSNPPPRKYFCDWVFFWDDIALGC